MYNTIFWKFTPLHSLYPKYWEIVIVDYTYRLFFFSRKSKFATSFVRQQFCYVRNNFSSQKIYYIYIITVLLVCIKLSPKIVNKNIQLLIWILMLVFKILILRVRQHLLCRNSCYVRNNRIQKLSFLQKVMVFFYYIISGFCYLSWLN